MPGIEIYSMGNVPPLPVGGWNDGHDTRGFTPGCHLTGLQPVEGRFGLKARDVIAQAGGLGYGSKKAAPACKAGTPFPRMTHIPIYPSLVSAIRFVPPLPGGARNDGHDTRGFTPGCHLTGLQPVEGRFGLKARDVIAQAGGLGYGSKKAAPACKAGITSPPETTIPIPTVLVSAIRFVPPLPGGREIGAGFTRGFTPGCHLTGLQPAGRGVWQARFANEGENIKRFGNQIEKGVV